ncbi:MAG TPA: ATP-binding cassette domain-containing protein, partial [Reyranellaceae bacterium]|nr:ATP-binding cassette domain-containing protein [Reyranellaceae bacterium]
MLEVRDLEVRYGPAQALWGVSLDVGAGELVSVVGPNGAGKTTLINTLAGLLRSSSGSLRFAGEEITRTPAHRFCQKGIAIVPEGRRLFTGMTVLENLELGSYLPEAKARRRQTLDEVLALFPALREKLPVAAG